MDPATLVFVFHLSAWISPPAVTAADGSVSRPPAELTFIHEYRTRDECEQAAKAYPDSAKAKCTKFIETTETSAK